MEKMFGSGHNKLAKRKKPGNMVANLKQRAHEEHR
jgi:hypothetical protein